MRDGALARAWPILAASVLLGITFASLNPWTCNGDDFIRYYAGGWIGARLLARADAEDLRAELRSGTARLEGTQRLRFVTAQTPYSPLLVATVPLAEAVRRETGPVGRPPVGWIFAFQVVLWVGCFVTAAWVAHARLEASSVPWLIVSCALLALVSSHTHPLGPVPRGYCLLLTGLAFALHAQGGAERYVWLLLLLAALFHPIQEGMLLSVGAAFGWILARRGPLALARDPATRRLACVVAASLAISGLVVWLSLPGKQVDVTRLVGGGFGWEVPRNWHENIKALSRMSRRLGPLLFLFAWIEAGWIRAAAILAVFLGSLAGVAALFSSPEYPGEYVLRMSGAWSVLAFTLMLRNDLLARARGKGRAAQVAVFVGCVGLIALFGRNQQPLERLLQTRAADQLAIGPVEQECLRILPDTSPR